MAEGAQYLILCRSLTPRRRRAHAASINISGKSFHTGTL